MCVCDDGLPGFGHGVHRAAKANVVASRSERLKPLVGGAGLDRAVAVSAAADNAARVPTRLCPQPGFVEPHIAHPLPNVARHVLTSVRTRAFREMPSRKL